MLDIPSISAIVATVGVLVGVAIAILELRDLVKTRQTDLVIRLYSTFGSKEMLEAWEKVRTREYTDLDGYLKKYGMSELIQVGLFFEGIGILQYRKLIDIGLVDDLFSTPIKWTWEKMKPLAEDYRKQSERPKYLSGLNTPTMKCRKENKHYDKHNNKHPFLFFYCFFHKS